VSREPQPQVAAGYSEVQQSMVNMLSALPEEEATAVLNRLGLSNDGEYDETSQSEEARSLYRKGMRKLRKLMLDPGFALMNGGQLTSDVDGLVIQG
jgi:hypothetical protein